MRIQIQFALEKQTPGALRYQEVTAEGTPIKITEGAKVGTLYVRKSALDGAMPRTLTATIETA